MDSDKPFNKSQRLFIELGTALSLQENEHDEALAGELIGMQVGSYLIVRVSESHAARAMPRADAPLRVKYLCSSEIFGFETLTILALERPERLLFLAYPTQVESFNVRSQARVECFLPVRLHWRDRVLPAMIVNVNFQGCLCALGECLSPAPTAHDPVAIELTIAGEATASIRGEARSVRIQPDKTELGIHYVRLDPFAQSALRALIPALDL